MRPNILSIAGFDPSGGAGVLADVKTAESNGVYCCGVITSLTYQNDAEFDDVDWIETENIIRQIHVLKRRISFDAVKIGLVADISTLETIVYYVKDALGSIPIVWDPILKATAGFEFHNEEMTSNCFNILRQLALLTPNIPESELLFKTSKPQELHSLIKEEKLCSILLKGGHSSGNDSIDFLIDRNNTRDIPGVKFSGFEKHGTGCILSSAIASGLSKGLSMYESCLFAKKYVSSIITSNAMLLGYHSMNYEL